MKEYGGCFLYSIKNNVEILDCLNKHRPYLQECKNENEHGTDFKYDFDNGDIQKALLDKPSIQEKEALIEDYDISRYSFHSLAYNLNSTFN